MKKVKFTCYNPKRGLRVLPGWIIDQLDELEENPPSVPCLPNANEMIIQAIRDKGLDSDELCRRMEKQPKITVTTSESIVAEEHEKPQITPDYIDKALADDSMETWLVLRFLNALDIEWEDYYRAFLAYEEKMEKIRGNERRILQDLKRYRRYGPYVHALIIPPKSMCHFIRSDDDRLIKLAMVDNEETFDPPSADQVAYTISRTFKSFMCKTTREHFEIGGYRYYRLPNETYDFDLEGNLVASGPICMDTPPEFMSLRVRMRGRFIRQAKPYDRIALAKKKANPAKSRK